MKQETVDCIQKRSKKRKNKGMKRGATVFLVTMLSIPILHWLIFWLYVNFDTILLAFQNKQGQLTFDNFRTFFDALTNQNMDLNVAVRNTLIYFCVSVFVTLPCSFVVAYFIFKKMRGASVFRVIFFLPSIISVVVMTMVFKQFIMPDGPLDSILHLFGISLPRAGLLGQSSTATKTIVAYVIWTGCIGSFMVIGGAMSRIPIELLEYSKMEGCSPFREMVHIILPLVWPTLSTILIVTMTGLFTASGPMVTLVDGNFDTWTISYWIFYKVNGDMTGGVSGGQYNLVSAAGLFFTMISVPVILLVRWIVEKLIPSVEY